MAVLFLRALHSLNRNNWHPVLTFITPHSKWFVTRALTLARARTANVKFISFQRFLEDSWNNESLPLHIDYADGCYRKSFDDVNARGNSTDEWPSTLGYSRKYFEQTQFKWAVEAMQRQHMHIGSVFKCPAQLLRIATCITEYYEIELHRLISRS